MNPHPRGLGTPVFGPGAAVRPTRIHSFTAPGINGAQMGPDAALLRRIPFSSTSRARLADRLAIAAPRRKLDQTRENRRDRDAQPGLLPGSMIPELRETDPGQDASNPGTDEFAEDLHLPALPAAVASCAEQHLRHGQAHELGVGEPFGPPGPWPLRFDDMVVDDHIQFR